MTRPLVAVDRCFHGRTVAEILDVPIEPTDAYVRQCICCLNVFPTRNLDNALCPECQAPPKIILPHEIGV